MSLTDLARIAGVAGSTIYAWESGKATPQVDKLASAMKVLGHPIECVVLIPEEERFPGDWRVLSGFTQPQLASAAGIATSTLQKIERGEAKLTDDQAATLSGLVRITEDEYRAAWRRARDRPPGTPA